MTGESSAAKELQKNVIGLAIELTKIKLCKGSKIPWKMIIRISVRCQWQSNRNAL